MLIIGHRGAAGSAPENTMRAMRHGHDAGADMLEFDVQVTRDGVPIVLHDNTLLRTHKKTNWIRFSTHKNIEQATAHGHQVATLEEVLDEFFGVVILNLELKTRGSAVVAANLLQRKYIKEKSDWSNLLISSFIPSELVKFRTLCPDADLSMMHYRNPFLFLAYQRKLSLTAVGFHRFFVGELPHQIAKRAGLFTYIYTVNRPRSAERFARAGYDGLVTDHPAEMRHYLAQRSI